MKKALIGLMLIVGFAFGAIDYEDRFDREFQKLDNSQKEMIQEIYNRSKPYDLVYSTLAIAWQESNFGKWNVNLADPSCGPFHQLVPLFIKKHKLENTQFMQNKVCGELINNLDLSVSTVISELEAWKVVHKNRWNTWEYVYRSYNAGYNYDSDKAKKYAKMIKARIKVLKKYIK